MAVNYEEARERLRAHLEPGWKWGTFCLDDRNIVENDEFYVFNVGAREYIIDGDFGYAIAGGLTVVFKEDGRIGAKAPADVAIDPTIRSRPNPNPTLTV